MKYLKYCLSIGVSALIPVLMLANCGEDNKNNSINSPTNSPPDTPYYPTPGNNATYQSIETDIYWRCTDPDGTILTYDVFFGTEEEPPRINEKQSETVYYLGTLDAFTTYYWKIIAYDSYNDSAVGPVWNFTTGPGVNYPPSQPGNPSPADGAVDQPANLILSWTCSDSNWYDELSYYVYFDTTENPVQVSYELTTSSYDPGALIPETHYYWKVIAYDSYGDSTIGPAWEFETGRSAEGVYAVLAIDREIAIENDASIIRDDIYARFDSAYAPYFPVIPMEADGVTCNEYVLRWNSELGRHEYSDPSDSQFIELGGDYGFEVFESLIIPALIDTFDFPSTAPTLTSPVDSDTVSMSGFDVAWTGDEDGTVIRLVLISDGDTAGVAFETDNDGSYSITSSDLEPLAGTAGEYELVIIRQNYKAITAVGYDSRSYIQARAISKITIHIE